MGLVDPDQTHRRAARKAAKPRPASARGVEKGGLVLSIAQPLCPVRAAHDNSQQFKHSA